MEPFPDVDPISGPRPSPSTDAPTVHHFVLVRNEPGSGNPPAAFGIFRRIDQHEISHVGVVQILDATIDPMKLGDQVCAMFDRELRGRVS